MTEVQRKGQDEVARAEDIAIDLQDLQHVAIVNVNAGLTKNLGNYESIRVGVSITKPCAPDDVSIEATYQECSAWAEEKLVEELEKATRED